MHMVERPERVNWSPDPESEAPEEAWREMQKSEKIPNYREGKPQPRAKRDHVLHFDASLPHRCFLFWFCRMSGRRTARRARNTCGARLGRSLANLLNDESHLIIDPCSSTSTHRSRTVAADKTLERRTWLRSQLYLSNEPGEPPFGMDFDPSVHPHRRRKLSPEFGSISYV